MALRISGDWRDTRLFNAVVVVVAVIMPAAIVIAIDDSFSSWVRVTAIIVGLAAPAALLQYTREQLRGHGRHRQD